MPDAKTSPEVAAPAPRAAAHRELVRAWVADWFHNAALPTHVQNRISEAAEDLVRRLEARKE